MGWIKIEKQDYFYETKGIIFKKNTILIIEREEDYRQKIVEHVYVTKHI